MVRVFATCSSSTLVKLTILPILDFGDVIYKIASNIILNKLDAVYHSAIRFVTKAPYTTHHCDLYALVAWPSLHTRLQTHWLQVIYKSLLGKAPPYLSSLVTNRSTRSSRYISLLTPKANSSFGRLSALSLTSVVDLVCKPVTILNSGCNTKKCGKIQGV